MSVTELKEQGGGNRQEWGTSALQEMTGFSLCPGRAGLALGALITLPFYRESSQGLRHVGVRGCCKGVFILFTLLYLWRRIQGPRFLNCTA